MAWSVQTLSLAVLASSLVVGQAAAEQPTPWIQKLNARVRLVDGGTLKVSDAPGDTQRLAAIQIEMAPGFKTYWRNPGDAGGIPPGIDMSKSSNLVGPGEPGPLATQVLYPAPHRYTDKAGASIGYKDKLTLPILIVARDKAAPVALKVTLAIGICREICIPVDADLELTLPTQAAQTNADVVTWLALVPQPQSMDAGLPQLKSVVMTASASSPKLVLSVVFPKGVAGADLFIEGPDGADISMTRTPPEIVGQEAKFEAAIADAATAEAIRGKAIKVTMVSQAGASEMTLIPR